MAATTNNIILSEGRRPLWQTCLAVLFYVLAFAFIVALVVLVYRSPASEGFKAVVSSFNCALFMLVLALRFSVVSYVCFDAKGQRYRKEYRVGPIRAGRWQQLPDIEYVSVFRQGITMPGEAEADGYMYNVNVWHGRNSHFTIYTSANSKPAYRMALYLAVRLKTEMLDATDPLNKIWILPEGVGL